MRFPIESFREVETPFYAYDMELLRHTLSTIDGCLKDKPLWKVHYAVKANNNPVLLDTISASGKFGADCVSIGEIEWAIKHGFAPADIMFAGVGKTKNEISRALDIKTGCFNVESLPELETINFIAIEKGVKAPVSIRINPDIDAHTHPNITTGTYEDQFGIPLLGAKAIISRAKSLEGILLKGLHFHIGSQITDMTPFKQLCTAINSLQDEWNKKGVYFDIINVGGGLGIDYEHPDLHPVADFKDYFKTFESLELRENQQLHFELGRAIVAQCGSLITRVLYIKEGIGKRFAIVDAGFNDLIRPALYDAYHKIELIDGSAGSPEKYDIVGPICESTDCFARATQLPALQPDDLLAVRSAGAYGESMASTYNMRPLPRSLFF